ncbi:hypothetical protein RT723_01090 [Psychrosphaera aquimarina]|uniref:HlyD family secretion protein n=1 Tax=Psychrosphaera aquimarina TaxID=2044854 RepID=A0ABU3QW19_9GAMM|nr:hypothetical protein [Psychrosphaera aquimarina]MDU0111626.1 hypothetical protein [Psychrosphaera aquimarina]
MDKPHLTTPNKANSGTAMDKQIEVKNTNWKVYFITIVIIAMAVVYYTKQPTNIGKSISVSSSDITTETVTTGIFEDYIPVRSRVVPLKTVYLDAVEGEELKKY